MARATLLWGAFLISLPILTTSPRASQIVQMTPREMGNESSVVVLGSVSGSSSYWNGTRTKILTETTIRVSEAYKGNAGPTVRIVQLGGVVGNVRVTVHGALVWRPGEEALLFLESNGNGAYRVTGFSQGRFLVERDPVTGEAYVKQPTPLPDRSLRITDSQSNPQLSTEERVSLHTFVREAVGLR